MSYRRWRGPPQRRASSFEIRSAPNLAYTHAKTQKRVHLRSWVNTTTAASHTSFIQSRYFDEQKLYRYFKCFEYPYPQARTETFEISGGFRIRRDESELEDLSPLRFSNRLVKVSHPIFLTPWQTFCCNWWRSFTQRCCMSLWSYEGDAWCFTPKLPESNIHLAVCTLQALLC